MARQKTITSINAAIIKTEEELAKVQAIYDKLAMELQRLRNNDMINNKGERPDINGEC